MTKTNIGASLADDSFTASPARIGLTNPTSRFRKLFPYVGAALIAVIAVAGSATMKGMADSRDWLGHTYQVKSELADLQLNHVLLHEYETATAAGSAEGRAALHSAGQAARQSLARLKELTSDNPPQQERLEQLEPLFEQHIRDIEAAAASGLKANLETEARMNLIIGDINTLETQLLGAREAAWD